MSLLKDKVNRKLYWLKCGQVDALQELYNITYDHLKLVALSYLSAPSDLEDVLSEAYIKVYKYCASTDIVKDGYNWMCKIVQNLAYDYNRNRRITVPFESTEKDSLSYEIDDVILQNSDLLQAIKTLPASNQELIYLRFWEDLTFDDIAIRTHQKKSTVYKKLKASLKVIENCTRENNEIK